jgi:hypothetical protein
MKIVIEFYRTRDSDGAHAVVGRETAEAADLDNAIEIARLLSKTLDMPQCPDAMTVTDGNGTMLCFGPVETDVIKGKAIMTNIRNIGNEQSRIAAISVWENEGGALGHDSMHHQYGRRIEADRSWTVYHVFTGIPGRFGGDAMTGLSRLDATRGMLRLNLRNVERRRERIELASFKTVGETAGRRS